MIQLTFSVNGQVLTRTDDIEIVSDAIGQFEAVFTFDEWWDGFTPTAQFTKDGKTYDSMLKDNTCEIPPEVLQGGGVFYVNVFATEDGDRKTANEVAVKVNSSGYKKDGAHSVKPTPTIYEQLLQSNEEIKEKLLELIKNGGQGGGITEITEETYIYDLAPGIYKINADDDSYCIYMDDCYWLCLYEGIVSFSYSEYDNMYSWFYVGRDMNNGTTAHFGKTYWNGEYWICDEYRDVYSQLESNTNRVNDFKKARYDNYPSTKAVVNYVAEQLANVGGSSVELVTEFGGIDTTYEENQVYNANAIHQIFTQIAEVFEAYEERISALEEQINNN